MQQECHTELLNYLNLAMIADSDDGETAVDDFTVVLFRILGYSHHPRLARTRVDLPLLICGESRRARTDVCIVDVSQNNVLLLVLEDKKPEEKLPDNARAQLVAEAVGAFTENKTAR